MFTVDVKQQNNNILQAKVKNAHGGKVSVMASSPGVVALLNKRGCNNKSLRCSLVCIKRILHKWSFGMKFM